jgi:hypothetical protein
VPPKPIDIDIDPDFIFHVQGGQTLPPKKLPDALLVTPVKLPVKPRVVSPPGPLRIEAAPQGQMLSGGPGKPVFKEVPEPQPEVVATEQTTMGHRVPQPIPDIRVLNANPEQQAVIDAIVPAIGAMQAQMTVQIEAALDRAHQAEEAAAQKVDKDFVNDFFRKMRMLMVELKQQVEGVKQQVPDRVTHDELKDFATELYSALSKDTSAAAGRISYNCLFCGQPRAAVSGMITDQAVADSLGEPPKTRLGGKGGTIMYGSDRQMYVGRGNLGRPTTAALAKIPPLRPTTANPEPS